MKRSRLCLYLVIAATSLSSCGPRVKVEPPREPITINLNIKIDQETRLLAKKEAQPSSSATKDIKLLSRAFLPRPILPEVGYGFYAYLLFPRNVPRTLEQRLAAAGAFLCLFEDVSEDRELVADRSALAVLYVPIEKIGVRDELLRTRDPARLLQEYDYSRARLFAVENGLDPDGLYVVGQTTIFAPERGADEDELQVFDFTDQRPDEIFAIFASLEDRLITDRVLVAEREVDLLETWRVVFRTLGEFALAPAELISPAEASPETVAFSCP